MWVIECREGNFSDQHFASSRKTAELMAVKYMLDYVAVIDGECEELTKLVKLAYNKKSLSEIKEEFNDLGYDFDFKIYKANPKKITSSIQEIIKKDFPNIFEKIEKEIIKDQII